MNDKEEKALDRYLIKVDELNAIVEEKCKEQIDIDLLINYVIEALIDAYYEGFSTGAYMLEDSPQELLDYISLDGKELPKDIVDKLTTLQEQATDTVFSETAGKTVIDRIKQYDITDIAQIKRAVETEYHRVFNSAELDYASRYGITATKTWITKADGRVRDTHSYLEGITIPADVEFFTYDGDSAQFPGGFSKAENNVNCRCIMSLGSI